jgi:hypothetical protein
LISFLSFCRLHKSDTHVLILFRKFDEFLFRMTIQFQALKSLNLRFQMLDNPLRLLPRLILQLKQFFGKIFVPLIQFYCWLARNCSLDRRSLRVVNLFLTWLFNNFFSKISLIIKRHLLLIWSLDFLPRKTITWRGRLIVVCRRCRWLRLI